MTVVKVVQVIPMYRYMSYSFIHIKMHVLRSMISEKKGKKGEFDTNNKDLEQKMKRK